MSQQANKRLQKVEEELKVLEEEYRQLQEACDTRQAAEQYVYEKSSERVID
jgi:cell shape-determining protein MreC